MCEICGGFVVDCMLFNLICFDFGLLFFDELLEFDYNVIFDVLYFNGSLFDYEL